ncbi:hybrid sensor histidine kinase/response regulator [Niveispirillum sp.]|uniref:ATP-binding protein n=1 Tax=Niveispirillum sp. TaxID=1917217 RepID=UPI001B50AC31|nr:HAMP domain-containing sensor histidine kinase [Niveispirillum sp.]MBP7337043.1 HAMP domain-containing histidine kinase [Niveispirillum sp.]
MHLKENPATILVIGGDKSRYPAPAALKRLTPPVDLRFLPTEEGVLSICRSHQPALMVVDLNGIGAPLGLVCNVKAADLPLDPTIIMVGDDVTPQQRTQAVELGVLEVMERPETLAELQIRLLAHLHLRQRLSQAEQVATERNQRLNEALDLLKAAQRKLLDQAQKPERASQRSTSDVLAGAAHELRTPLNAIIGFSELIRDEAHGPHGDPRYGEYAVDIHQAATHMLTIVDGTLDLARAEAGAEPLDIRDIDIGRTVQESARMLRQLAEGTGINLDIKVPDIPLRIRTDPEKIRQIVLNLASNAIKFTPRGGRVTVEVAGLDDGGAVILVIRDTGIGIPTQEIATAMRPFGQVRQADRPHPKGTGLGLPLTRRFVEMLGGELDISSVPGKGTVVSVRLPSDAPDPVG